MTVACDYIDCNIRGVCSGHGAPSLNQSVQSQATPLSFDNGSTQINNYGTFNQNSNPQPDNSLWSVNITPDILPLLIFGTIVIILILAIFNVI